MINSIILILIGFLLWKFLPGKITAAPKNIRTYIDLGAQILGIIFMLSGVVNFIKSLFL